jgi:hypothetical protein
MFATLSIGHTQHNDSIEYRFTECHVFFIIVMLGEAYLLLCWVKRFYCYAECHGACHAFALFVANGPAYCSKSGFSFVYKMKDRKIEKISKRITKSFIRSRLHDFTIKSSVFVANDISFF